MAETEIAPLKTCSKCAVAKPATIENFYRRPEGSFFARCKKCDRAASAARYKANPEPAKARTKAWYRDNTDRATAYHQARYSEQPEPYKERANARYAANPEEGRRKSAEWRNQNMERHIANVKKWQANNAELVTSFKKANKQKRRAASLTSHHTAKDVRAILKSQKGKCWWCGIKVTKYHVDHRIPLSRGGSNAADNIVISCPPCNLKKHAKMPWEMENPRLL